MALAMLFPEPEKGGRGNKRKGGETPGFSDRRLYDARAVLRYSRELAEAVRDAVLELLRWPSGRWWWRRNTRTCRKSAAVKRLLLRQPFLW